MRDRSFTSIETERLRLRRFAPARRRGLRMRTGVDDDGGPIPVVAGLHRRDAGGDASSREMDGADPGVPGESVPVRGRATRATTRSSATACSALDAGDPATAEIGYTLAPRAPGARATRPRPSRALLGYAFGTQGVAPVRAVTDDAQRGVDPRRRAARDVGSSPRVHTTFKGERVRRAHVRAAARARGQRPAEPALLALVLDGALVVDQALLALPHELLQHLLELRVGTAARAPRGRRVLQRLDREVDLAVFLDRQRPWPATTSPSRRCSCTSFT